MIYVLGLLFSFFLGSIGFYLYKFTNKDFIIGFLFSKNFSLLQYLKNGYTPMLMWMIVELFRLKSIHNIVVIKGLSFLIFTIVFVINFFILKKILKFKKVSFFIISFYISLLLAYITTFLLNNAIYLSNIINFIGISFFVLVLFSYFFINIKIKKSDSTLA